MPLASTSTLPGPDDPTGTDPTTTVPRGTTTTSIVPPPDLISPGEFVATLFVASEEVHLDGERAGDGDRVRAYVVLSTTSEGAGVLEFTKSNTRCEIRQNSEIKVVGSADYLFEQRRGAVDCVVRPQGGRPVHIKARAYRIELIDTDAQISIIGTSVSVRVTRGVATVYGPDGSRSVSRDDGDTVFN